MVKSQDENKKSNLNKVFFGFRFFLLLLFLLRKYELSLLNLENFKKRKFWKILFFFKLTEKTYKIRTINSIFF